MQRHSFNTMENFRITLERISSFGGCGPSSGDFQKECWFWDRCPVFGCTGHHALLALLLSFLQAARLCRSRSASIACSSEANRNTQVRYSKHSLCYPRASLRRWSRLNSPQTLLEFMGVTDFVRLGERPCLYMLRTKWVKSTKHSPFQSGCEE